MRDFFCSIKSDLIAGSNKYATEEVLAANRTTRGEDLTVKGKSDAKFLVISGKPINEEIARGGPFVMNTKAEILQAVQDYHNGTFVK